MKNFPYKPGQAVMLLMFKKGDLIIFLLLLIAGLSWFMQTELLIKDQNKRAVIEIDGTVYKSFNLNNNTKDEALKIELPHDNFIHVTINKEKVYVTDVSCPDKLCKKTGSISNPGKSIICLPNKVVIYIKVDDDASIDDISY